MFKKKTKKPKAPDLSKLPVLPNDLAEHVQDLTGLQSKEFVKLFESLSRIDGSIVVSRRRPVKGKNVSKEVGGKQRKMQIDDAAEYEKKRAENRTVKETRIKELTEIETDDIIEREDINDEIYPKRLAPTDIVRYTSTAKDRLEELDRLRAKQVKIFSPREEVLLDVLTWIKKFEVVRLARSIAEKQRESIQGITLEELNADKAARLRKLKGEPEPETPEQAAERLKKEDEQRVIDEAAAEAAAEEAKRTLEGFDKDIHTLTDEAGMLVSENPDAAAAVLRQWIGSVVNSE